MVKLTKNCAIRKQRKESKIHQVPQKETMNKKNGRTDGFKHLI